MTTDIRKLREKLRKIYIEINTEFHDVIEKMDKTLESLEVKDGD